MLGRKGQKGKGSWVGNGRLEEEQKGEGQERGGGGWKGSAEKDRREGA